MKASHFCPCPAPRSHAGFAPSPHLTRSAEAAPTSAEDLIPAGPDMDRVTRLPAGMERSYGRGRARQQILVALIVKRAVNEGNRTPALLSTRRDDRIDRRSRPVHAFGTTTCSTSSEPLSPAGRPPSWTAGSARRPHGSPAPAPPVPDEVGVMTDEEHRALLVRRICTRGQSPEVLLARNPRAKMISFSAVEMRAGATSPRAHLHRVAPGLRRM